MVTKRPPALVPLCAPDSVARFHLLSPRILGAIIPLFTGVRGRCILRSWTSALRSSKKFALRVDLLLDHRLCWLRGGYGVCVPMHNLPLTVFRSKDHRSPHSVRGDVLPGADLGLCPLYLHNVG